MPDPSPTVNIQQAVELTGVSRRSIYNWVALDKVEHYYTAGGGLRIYRDSLFQQTRQKVRNSRQRPST